MITITSTTLLDGLKDQGNAPVWSEFCTRYRPVIVAFARRLGMSEDDAQDAAQEALITFAAAYREGKYSRDKGRLRSWLLTLAKDKPFTFLDHAIRCGDSLVGLSSIDQLLRFSMTEGAGVRPLMEQQRQQIERRLDAVRLLRRQIETLPSNTPQDIERKAAMLANVEDQTRRLTYAADLLLAAT